MNSAKTRGPDGGAEGGEKMTYKKPKWRRSRALGKPFEGGKLVRGVRLPKQGRHYFTWNPIDGGQPNPAFRRWGTDVLIREVLKVLRELRRDNPGAPRIGVADLSLRRGGEFGVEYGGLGHSSHQNGLDMDIHYPRLDGREKNTRRIEKLDLDLSQDLVDRLVAAGAEYVFVGPNTGLTGPKKVVVPLAHHDNHLHLRIYNTTLQR